MISPKAGNTELQLTFTIKMIILKQTIYNMVLKLIRNSNLENELSIFGGDKVGSL